LLGLLGRRQAVPIRVEHDDVTHAVAVGLDRFVADAVRGEVGQVMSRSGRPSVIMAPTHPVGADVSIVDDDPRVRTGLPQVLLADDPVRRASG
jgi:hypothetical protein